MTTPTLCELEGRLAGALRDVAAGVPDEHGSAPHAAIARLRDGGLLAAVLPEGAGGLGLCEPGCGPALRRILTAVGRASQVVGRLYEGHVNAHALVLRYGDEAARSAMAADALGGHLSGVWNTEPREGGVRIDAQAGCLRGGKVHASGAGFLTRPLVTAAREDGRRQMLIVPLAPGERADLSGWRARGMRASATGAVCFDGYPTSRAQPVGMPDDYHEEPFFSAGAWRFLAVHLGGIEAVHAAHKAHVARLGRSDDPFQLERLGRSAIALETAAAFVARACAAADATDPLEPGSVCAVVGLARAAVERAGLDAIELAQRSVGLAAMMEDHPLERLTRDLAVYLRQPGPDAALVGAARRLFEIEECYL